VQRLADARESWRIADQVDQRGRDDADSRLSRLHVPCCHLRTPNEGCARGCRYE
jgi:hypothetical protein